jgi:hypothetical protein
MADIQPFRLRCRLARQFAQMRLGCKIARLVRIAAGELQGRIGQIDFVVVELADGVENGSAVGQTPLSFATPSAGR